LGLSFCADDGTKEMALAMRQNHECERGERCRMRIGRCWSRCCGFLSVPTGAAGRRLTRVRLLNGVLWILRTGAQWRELPSMYPPYQTVHGRFQQWVRSGQLEKALRILTEKLRPEGKLNPD
jgi:hypothetical protein